MAFSGGVFSLVAGNPVVTGTTISSTTMNNTLSDIATGLSTCVLKDGSQTITANIPMSSFKFTGLAAGSANGDSLRYEQVNGVVTTAGDLLYASGAGALSRLAIGTARQQLATNAGATAPEWVASLQSLMTQKGDLVAASAANTPAQLSVGTDGWALLASSGAATGLAWTALATANLSDATAPTTWTPTDASGAGLSLTVNDAYYTKIGKMVTVIFNITYPATADGTAAKIGGLPANPKALAGADQIYMFQSGSNFQNNVRLANSGSAATMTFASNTGTSLKNSDLSAVTISGTFTYIAV